MQLLILAHQKAYPKWYGIMFLECMECIQNAELDMWRLTTSSQEQSKINICYPCFVSDLHKCCLNKLIWGLVVQAATGDLISTQKQLCGLVGGGHTAHVSKEHQLVPEKAVCCKTAFPFVHHLHCWCLQYKTSNMRIIRSIFAQSLMAHTVRVVRNTDSQPQYMRSLLLICCQCTSLLISHLEGEWELLLGCNDANCVTSTEKAFGFSAA